MTCKHENTPEAIRKCALSFKYCDYRKNKPRKNYSNKPNGYDVSKDRYFN